MLASVFAAGWLGVLVIGHGFLVKGATGYLDPTTMTCLTGCVGLVEKEVNSGSLIFFKCTVCPSLPAVKWTKFMYSDSYD